MTMKKTYISPSINVVTVKTTIMAASLGMNETPADDFNSAHGRHQSIQWIDDEEDEI